MDIRWLDTSIFSAYVFFVLSVGPLLPSEDLY